MSWKPSGEGGLSGTSLKLLVMCWRTMFEHVLKHGPRALCLKFSVTRSDPRESTMGLLRLLGDDVAGEKKVTFICGKLVISVNDQRGRVITVGCSEQASQGRGPKVHLESSDELFSSRCKEATGRRHK
mmetsp:Transcript_18065/g.30217  ORF Transcript_18065/g.30217 Transcript_18065/m.30217 type:complete len:128 (+) Transcript_18065:144-527(+)